MISNSYQGFSLLFVHDDFVVLNKAPGIGMHDEEGSAGLVSEARAQLGMELYPVHRLDKVTSGLLLLARNSESNRALSMAFAERHVTKIYLALSQHKPKKKQGWIKGGMVRGRRGSWLLTRSQENPAVTWFESDGLGDGLRLFRVQPKTGKTHQIRVALKSLGAPILGDELYGAGRADRVYLHAFELAFSLKGECWRFNALPEQGEWFDDPRVQAALATHKDPAS
ncbi:MAG: TIGR01621 family pseudouridine synthase [Aeromonadaceae bacterium]